MDDTEQTSWSNQEGLGRRRSAPEEESLLSEVEIGREDPVQQWHLRSFERQALREIVPMVQSLQMHELPMFTMPQLLQACSEVIEQICSVAMEGETPTSESADQKDEVMVLRDRFSLGYGCYVDQDALPSYVQLFADEKVGFICEPVANGTWRLLKASVLSRE